MTFSFIKKVVKNILTQTFVPKRLRKLSQTKFCFFQYLYIPLIPIKKPFIFLWFVSAWMQIKKSETIIHTSENKFYKKIIIKSDVNILTSFFSKIIVLSVYNFYLKKFLKYTSINDQTSKVTENGFSNNTFCFTRSSTAGKLQLPKIKKNAE